jgi:hypothetical protein
MLEPLIIHDQHNQVHAFEANLQAPASAANRNERWRGPAIGCAARCYSASVLAANNEAAFDQVRNH